MTQHKRIENVPKEVVYAVTCDACGKEKNAEDGWTPAGWHRFNSHHSEWGNDSHESYEYFDVCSFACYLTVVRKTYDEIGVHPSFEADEKDRWFVADMLASFPTDESENTDA